MTARDRLERLVDARVLVWLLVLVFATGTPLMLWFDADAAAHRAALGPLGTGLRALHSASTALLVVATLGHLVLRLARRAGRSPSRRGIGSGAIAMAAVGIATVTGAMVAQTGASHRLLVWVGLAESKGAVVALAVVHIAYATLLVLLAVYFHIARWGWGYVFSRWGQLVLAVVVTAALALAAGTMMPGDVGHWRGITWVAVPPVPVLWAWTLLVPLGVWLLASRLSWRTKRPK